MKNYLLAHDLGTSGNKATLFATDGTLINSKTSSYPTRYSNSNRAEQNPEDWWSAVRETTRSILLEIDKSEIAAVCFSGQMMGCLCVDARGRPLRDSIIYSDQRAVEEANLLTGKIGPESVYRITGHRCSSSYSIEKLMWVRKHEPEVYRQTHKMLNAKDYLNFRLTGRFCSEQNDASGTNAYDINRKCWSGEIVEAAGIDPEKLPEVLESTSLVGEITPRAARDTGLAEGTPVVAGAGDGGCATVGVGSVAEGITYTYLGSSSWISTTSRAPVFDATQRTFTWCHPVPGYFQPCGTMQTAGGAYSWLKDQVCGTEVEQAVREGKDPYELINAEIEKSPPGARGVYFLPYLLGERSPRWNPNAKGAWIGLKLQNRREDLLRAVLEGVSLNLGVILTIIEELVPAREMILIGGGAKGATWRQLLADVYDLPVLVPERLEEATSMGAAIIGGVGAGCFDSFDSAGRFVRIGHRLDPDPERVRLYRAMRPVFDGCYSALEPIFEII
jgi:xylulokinase